MDEVISFDKSLQTRLEEYNKVFCDVGPLPFSKLQKEWAYYLEFTLDPNGWQAIWKIPRVKCEELNIPFPSIVLVYVLKVNYEELIGLVRILAVQEDIHLADKHYVPLSQLWPTRRQDKTIALNMNSTANTLDMLRFFYIHLVMPWDEDDDTIDWRGTHLITRLRLYYDLKNGKIPKAMAEHIYALLNEARRLNSKRRILKSSCEELDIDDIDNGFSNKELEMLVEINVRLIEIQNEIQLLENEMFRNVIVKREQSVEITVDRSKDGPAIWLIFKEGLVKDYMAFLKLVEGLYPDKPVTFATDFMSKLEMANLDDVILLSEGQHKIRDRSAILDNFNIKGIGNRDSIQVMSFVDDVTMDCVGNYVILENITLNCKRSQCGILVRKGSVTLKNCRIIGDEESSTRQGILVLKGAELKVVDCEITGFAMSILGNTGSTIKIENSVISGSNYGVKLFDKCQLELRNTRINKCRQFGVLLETNQHYDSELIVGDFKILKRVPHIICESVNGDDNELGDVKIRRDTLKAKDDLFDNPDLDPTILESSDEEMETSLNNTVLEVAHF
ncbi:hypothetical protein GWI33_017344 [Rhynchophorus ferrugineus]|uniref:Right handed beta helix domain-containing protein n=1 Tax=Rhynchophorus ferrugineus TaxID=354439 RepID=A0A834HYZ5_RHYFE|nr:hypothetical protein GWI33_017344 [Rhynchophorus ferrugineus]